MFLKELKKILLDKDMTMTELAQRLGKLQGKSNYSISSFSQKLNNETISHKEVEQIAEILDYKILLVDKNKFRQ